MHWGEQSANSNVSFHGPWWCCKCNTLPSYVLRGVGVSGALGTVKYFRTCPVRDPGRVRLDLKYMFTFSLLRLSPVTIWRITADIEHASRYGVTSRWSIMNLRIEIGHVVIYARVVDIDFENCDDNVTRQPCLRVISPRNWSPSWASSSYRGIENPTCVHFLLYLPTWAYQQ